MTLLASTSKDSLQRNEPESRSWTREEYIRLAEQGFFAEQRVLLFEGVIFRMPPQGLPHSLAIELVDAYVRLAYPVGHRFRTQMPFYSADGSEPEPDIAVIVGSLADKVVSHPTTASLIVEVSDTSVRLDRAKAAAYAASGVPEYWIINLVDSVVEIHRDPTPNSTTTHSYGLITMFARGKSIAPASAPHTPTLVDALLP